MHTHDIQDCTHDFRGLRVIPYGLTSRSWAWSTCWAHKTRCIEKTATSQSVSITVAQIEIAMANKQYANKSIERNSKNKRKWTVRKNVLSTHPNQQRHFLVEGIASLLAFCNEVYCYLTRFIFVSLKFPYIVFLLGTSSNEALLPFNACAFACESRKTYVH